MLNQQSVEKLCQLLKSTREQKGYSLLKVSEYLKVPSKKIEQLENAEFQIFHESFLKGLIRSYAKYLGIGDQIAELFQDIWGKKKKENDEFYPEINENQNNKKNDGAKNLKSIYAKSYKSISGEHQKSLKKWLILLLLLLSMLATFAFLYFKLILPNTNMNTNMNTNFNSVKNSAASMVASTHLIQIPSKATPEAVNAKDAIPSTPNENLKVVDSANNPQMNEINRGESIKFKLNLKNPNNLPKNLQNTWLEIYHLPVGIPLNRRKVIFSAAVNQNTEVSIPKGQDIHLRIGNMQLVENVMIDDKALQTAANTKGNVLRLTLKED